MQSDAAAKMLLELRKKEPDPDESKILQYLEGGTKVFVVPGLAFDLLDPTAKTIGPPDVYTDGIWAWSAELLYYISRYHIAIPNDFVLQMRSHEWVCPPVTDFDSVDMSGLFTM